MIKLRLTLLLRRDRKERDIRRFVETHLTRFFESRGFTILSYEVREE